MQIGEIVVHPSHGRGTIVEIKKMMVLGKISEYYVLSFSNELDKILVPTNRVSEIGIRRPVSSEVLTQALTYLESSETETPDPRSNFHRVHKEYSERIASGNIIEVVKVYKALLCKGASRELGLKDKLLLEKTEQLLVGEISAICSLSPEESLSKLQNHVSIN